MEWAACKFPLMLNLILESTIEVDEQSRWNCKLPFTNQLTKKRLIEQQGCKQTIFPFLNNGEHQAEQLHFIWCLAQNLSASDPNEVVK